MTFRPFARFITTATALMAGLALFAIAASGVRAVTSHLWYGNFRSALIVGTIAALCFAASLMFLMPGQRRRIIAAGEAPNYRPVVRLAASLVMFAVLIAAAVLERGAGDKTFGLVPRGLIFPASLAFAMLLLVTFIYPGLAYRLSDRPRTEPRPEPRPAPEMALQAINLRSPVLRLGLRLLGIGYLVLVALAFYFWLFAKVIPHPAIIEANRSYFALSLLLLSLPIAIPVLRTPITGDGTAWTDHLRAKWAAMLGLVMFNSLIVLVLPERGLPILANAALGASLETRPYTVVSSKPKSGLKGCGAKMVILLNPETGRTYGLCGMSKAIAERAAPGDTLHVLGKTSGYGLVIQRVMVTKVPDAPAPQPWSRQRLTIG